MEYSPEKFYAQPSKEFLQPGDILFIKNFVAYDDMYWMVLNSFCDLERRDHILLARIISLKDQPKYKKSMFKKGKVFYGLYLPSLEAEFDESFVHYGMIENLPRVIAANVAKDVGGRIVISLSDEGRRLFQYHLANHLTRDVGGEYFKNEIEGIVDLLIE